MECLSGEVTKGKQKYAKRFLEALLMTLSQIRTHGSHLVSILLQAGETTTRRKGGSRGIYTTLSITI